MNLLYSSEPTQEQWDERKAIIDDANKTRVYHKETGRMAVEIRQAVQKV